MDEKVRRTWLPLASSDLGWTKAVASMPRG